MRARTRWTVAVGGAVAAISFGVIAAFACTSLAQLNLSQAAGPAGSQINVTGSAFNSVDSGNTPVALHWNTVDGPVLGTVNPDPSGAIGPVAVTVPNDLTPGFYTIVATQSEVPGGQPSWGTPARAAFQVTGSAAGSAGSTVTTQPAATNAVSQGIGAGVVGLLVALGIAGVALFGLGAATFIGSVRRAPSATRVRK